LLNLANINNNVIFIFFSLDLYSYYNKKTMLQSLTIRNYALIDSLDIDFFDGLSVITGETGAGKSVLLGALGLILGHRADTSVLKDKEKKCFVEARFKISKLSLKYFFDENDLDYEDITTIRREMNSNGKSRAFINDTPVNIRELKIIGAKLVDIHSQHQNLLLEDDTFQLNVLDTFARNDEIFENYYIIYKKYKILKKQYQNLYENAQKSQSDLDYLKFQFEQLENANLKNGEQKALEYELEELNHTEEIKQNLANAHKILTDEQISVVDNLKLVKDSVQSIVKFFPKTEDIFTRLESTYIEIQDITNEIDVLAENVEHDPNRIEFIRERLDTIYSLQQKHNVNSVENLLLIKEKLELEISKIDSYDFELNKLEKELKSVENSLEQISNMLTESRLNVFDDIENKIIESLITLGIKNAAFKISHKLSNNYTVNGKDIIEFNFSANKNTDLQLLSKVASGGELSRLMLSLKSIIAEKDDFPTIILDEIDTGTSGEIADKMGSIMKRMSMKMQVIAITHLAQIASKGNKHYLVYKEDNETSTYTDIKLLNNKERVLELAKMLSGENLSDAAIQNAKVLLEQ